jgi:hypothetical protein
MEPGSTQAPPPADAAGRSNKLKLLYWVAAAAMVIATVIEFRERPDYLRASSRVALLGALVLLATARPAESRAKKVVIYALLAIAIGLLVARLASA